VRKVAVGAALLICGNVRGEVHADPWVCVPAYPAGRGEPRDDACRWAPGPADHDTVDIRTLSRPVAREVGKRLRARRAIAVEAMRAHDAAPALSTDAFATKSCVGGQLSRWPWALHQDGALAGPADAERIGHISASRARYISYPRCADDCAERRRVSCFRFGLFVAPAGSERDERDEREQQSSSAWPPSLRLLAKRDQRGEQTVSTCRSQLPMSASTSSERS
jgi:hypothetical protein